MTRYSDKAAEVQAAIFNTEFTNRYGTFQLDEYDWSELAWGDREVGELPGLGFLEVVETVGGGEGSGEHMHIVFKLTPDAGPEEFYKVDGYYASYDGSDWSGSDLYAVTPVERTVTFYE